MTDLRVRSDEADEVDYEALPKWFQVISETEYGGRSPRWFDHAGCLSSDRNVLVSEPYILDEHELAEMLLFAMKHNLAVLVGGIPSWDKACVHIQMAPKD